MRLIPLIASAAGALALVGCAALAVRSFDERLGRASPKEYIAVSATAAPIEYLRDIRPLMEQRCLVCHGCYDAPCQLKLDSYEGLLRGANATPVYRPERLTPAAPTRLFEDAFTTREWRTREFQPVLNERAATPQANLEAGVLARLLDLKQRHPLPPGKVLGKPFDFSLDAPQQCPSIEAFEAHASARPLAGMPYGFPALDADEHQRFTAWLAAGAPAAAEPPLPAALAAEATRWESFFQGTSDKQRLWARYLYEHLYLAHLYFEDAGRDTVFFKLVRSRTPPGQPIDPIATRRPYDDPGVARVYYRLWRDPASVVAKTHMPYLLSAERMAKWKRWFADAPYAVDKLPGYEPSVASNPFIAFQALPVEARHAFLLDEAAFTVMNFIKGPVCRGNVALDVIRDRFWVFFTPPKSTVPRQFTAFLAGQDAHLRLPAESGSRLLSITDWQGYARAQGAYLRAKGAFIRDNLATFEEAGLGNFWDGGPAHNPNAALTVMRHNDSATVVQGLVGEVPQTAWLIDYPILERIHYLLVAGFDVYGTGAHQAMTRMYMDFLRMEAEMNFVAFLPPPQRRAEIADWYRGAAGSVHDYVENYFDHEVLPAPYPYRSADPKRELFGALRERLAPSLNRRHELSSARLAPAELAALDRIEQVRGVPASLVPQSVVVRVEGQGLFTLLSNSAHTNISSMFGEQKRRAIPEDSLTIAPGVLTAYPNMLWHLRPGELPELADRLAALRSEADYAALLDRFGMRRTDPAFWALSDQVLSDYRRADPLQAGVLDYNRYENR